MGNTASVVGSVLIEDSTTPHISLELVRFQSRFNFTKAKVIISSAERMFDIFEVNN